MKTIKTWLATIAALLFSISASAHDFKVDKIYYKKTSDTTVGVTYRGNRHGEYSYEYSGNVVIPSTVTYLGKEYSVTSIESYAFSDCSGLKSLTIGNSVTHIGSAFDNCSGLKSVTIGNSVTSIMYDAFSPCYFMTKVINFSKLNITKGSSSNGYVGYYADVVVNNPELIDNYLFAPCGDTYALYGYVGTDTNLQLPEKYKGENYIIGDYAFWKCSGLTSVTIPNSVTSIGAGAFDDCTLKNLTIGSGVLSIGSNQSKPTKAIWLTNTPPNGYTNLAGTINYVANDNYTQLSNIKVYKYLSSYFEVDGIVYVPVNPSARTCDAITCSYDSTATSISIVETVSYKGVAMSVENVMPYTAYGQTTVKTLNLSPKCDIGAYAFYGCTGITDATISNKGDIGDNAFYGCTGVTNATISNEGNIGADAFRGCDNLSSITLGDSIKSIGDYAFYGCSKLTEVTIPNKTTSLGGYCFSGNSLLANIDLGNGLKTIGQYCFSGCSMPEISIPASVTSIGNYTFNNCISLADVVIEDRTSELTLGSNGSSPLFASCPLDSVYIGGKIKYNTSSSSCYSPFYRNTSLRTIVITDEEEEIYNNEFYGCTNLKNVTMGDGVKKIGNWAFSGCSNLDYFNFGSGMQSIGDEAFSDCTNLTMLISYAEVPPTCGSMALDDINKWSCVLKVPESSISAYQAADGWKEFFFIESLPTAITEITEDGNHCNGTNVYTIGGMKVTNTGKLSKGIYIVDGKKVIID